jgi:hypothetical protein
VEWSAKVELFEQLRREYEFGIGTIRGVARKFGVHRRLVREAARQALPPLRKIPARARPRLDPLLPFIDGILASDRTAPASSGTRRGGSFSGCGRNSQSSRSRSRRSASTCARASTRSGSQAR